MRLRANILDGNVYISILQNDGKPGQPHTRHCGEIRGSGPHGLGIEYKTVHMATILRLTKMKAEEPVRVNFDNVAFYHRKGEHTLITFVSPRFHEHTLTVKESIEQVDKLLGI